MGVRGSSRETGSRRPSNGMLLLQCVVQERLAPLDAAGPWTAAEVDALLDDARYHRLDAFLADLGVRDRTASQHLHQRLSDLRTTRLMRHAALRADLELVARALEGSGLPWVVLKGPVTAQRHYARPQQRSFSDLDVLVDPADFEPALEALTSDGAQLLDRNWGLIDRLACGELNLLLPFGTLLDLHWDLMSQPHDRRGFRVTSPDVVARRVPLETSLGVVVPAIDPVDELLHLCLHAVTGGTNSLGRLRDIALAASRPLDVDVVVARAAAWRTELLTAVGIERATALFGTSAAPGLLEGLSAGRAWKRVMQLAGRAFPETSAPPSTRRTAHLKLTRSSELSSVAYSASEVVGYALRGLWSRSRDGWDAGMLQLADRDEVARASYLRQVAASGR